MEKTELQIGDLLLTSDGGDLELVGGRILCLTLQGMSKVNKRFLFKGQYHAEMSLNGNPLGNLPIHTFYLTEDRKGIILEGLPNLREVDFDEEGNHLIPMFGPETLF